MSRSGHPSGSTELVREGTGRFPRRATTPLLSLVPLLGDAGGIGELWAKAEFLQPSGSVKDRAAVSIVEAALAAGHLGGGQTLVDASSGNTAVAYALIASELGFPVELFVPGNAHPDRLRRLRELGAKVVLTDPAEGTDGAQREARARAESDSRRYFYADQYNNPANPLAHYRSTAPEIWEQTRGRVTIFVAGVGTGGTISGVGKFLKERNPLIEVIAVEPTGPIHGLEGLKHLPTAVRPSTYDGSVVDSTERVETEEAQECVARIAQLAHLTVGASLGAAVAVALRSLRRRPGSVVVTVLPDEGHAREPGATG